jgi:hypothetical protein
MQHLQLLLCNNGYTNTPQHYVIRTVPVLRCFSFPFLHRIVTLLAAYILVAFLHIRIVMQLFISSFSPTSPYTHRFAHDGELLESTQVTKLLPLLCTTVRFAYATCQ